VTRPRSLPQYFGRALRLRCPACGVGPLYKSWFKLHERCANCGRRFERQEEGYRTVAYFVNLVFSEFVLMAILITWLVLTWPNPDWERVQLVGAVSMVVAPLLLYPVSRALFLAADFFFRPQDIDDVD
jgi:uncharacterized protein (DUF983 family)